MGRGGASRDRRGQCSLFYEGGSRDEIPDLMGRAHFSSSDRAGLVSHTHAAVDPPSVSEAHRKLHCRVHAYHRCYSFATTESRNKAALQVCVLWRCRCAFSGAACARMRRHRPRVCLSAFGPARSPAMTGSGALHCDVRVAAQVRRLSPSGLPACLHPRMRRSEAARAWSTACWNVRRRVCCSGTRTRVLCSGCTALSQTSGHSTVNFVPSPFRPR